MCCFDIWAHDWRVDFCSYLDLFILCQKVTILNNPSVSPITSIIEEDKNIFSPFLSSWYIAKRKAIEQIVDQLSAKLERRNSEGNFPDDSADQLRIKAGSARFKAPERASFRLRAHLHHSRKRKLFLLAGYKGFSPSEFAHFFYIRFLSLSPAGLMEQKRAISARNN